MPISLLMPALSPTMTEGTLARWLKKEGDPVEPGDLLAEIETDKATMEFEAVDSGILGKILVPAGTNGVKVNSIIGLILEEGEELGEIPSQVENNSAAEEIILEEKAVNQERIIASPLAKNLAKEAGIDLSTIEGSGPYGRIVKRDLEQIKAPEVKSIEAKVIPQNPPQVLAVITSPSPVMPVSKMRQVIADRLLESKRNIPHFYLTLDCNVTELLAFREKTNQELSSVNKKISINDLVVRASALALQDLPGLNSSWQEGQIIQNTSVDISVAVALQEGLITPIVKEANNKSLTALSDEIKQLVIKAKENRLKPEEFQGGGLTISNLGSYGIDQFFAIINLPQAAIVAVGSVIKKPIVLGDLVVIGDMMTISLSCDHRLVDGALAASFLSKIKLYLEKPFLLV
jgi:pyruvate dehydrogenase E2 component (dihydrolipoamide acetyltransferase)